MTNTQFSAPCSTSTPHVVTSGAALEGGKNAAARLVFALASLAFFGGCAAAVDSQEGQDEAQSAPVTGGSFVPPKASATTAQAPLPPPAPLPTPFWGPTQAPLQCNVKTASGNYLTMNFGGGATTDVIHTDATIPRAWETITFIDTGNGAPNWYGLRTSKGYFLTADDGVPDARNPRAYAPETLRSTSTTIWSHEMFLLDWLPGPGRVVAIKTPRGRYLTAVDGGGRTTDAIHTTAATIGPNETFNLVNCVQIAPYFP